MDSDRDEPAVSNAPRPVQPEAREADIGLDDTRAPLDCTTENIGYTLYENMGYTFSSIIERWPINWHCLKDSANMGTLRPHHWAICVHSNHCPRIIERYTCKRYAIAQR